MDDKKEGGNKDEIKAYQNIVEHANLQINRMWTACICTATVIGVIFTAASFFIFKDVSDAKKNIESKFAYINSEIDKKKKEIDNKINSMDDKIDKALEEHNINLLVERKLNQTIDKKLVAMFIDEIKTAAKDTLWDLEELRVNSLVDWALKGDFLAYQKLEGYETPDEIKSIGSGLKNRAIGIVETIKDGFKGNNYEEDILEINGKSGVEFPVSEIGKYLDNTDTYIQKKALDTLAKKRDKVAIPLIMKYIIERRDSYSRSWYLEGAAFRALSILTGEKPENPLDDFFWIDWYQQHKNEYPIK